MFQIEQQVHSDTTVKPLVKSSAKSLAKSSLPTMYDLPSEDPEEPGLPDEYHYDQPPLLSHTFRPPNYAPERVFHVGDMNLYYDVEHPLWHKRPDWFGVVGVPRFYDRTQLRLSYVMWQEEVSPFVIVELLSPGTEKDDLGETESSIEAPPTKWEVYEQILQVPYYVTFSRYTDKLQVFALQDGRYRELDLIESRVWMPEIQLGIGLWQGEHHGRDRLWLRWFDIEGNWVPTEAEAAQQRADMAQQRADMAQQRADMAQQQAEAAQQQAETERQRAETERQRAESLAQRLRELGVEL